MIWGLNQQPSDWKTTISLTESCEMSHSLSADENSLSIVHLLTFTYLDLGRSGKQPKQRGSDLLLPNNLLQRFWEDTETLPRLA